MIDQNQVNRLLELLSLGQKLFLIFANTHQQDLLLAVLASYLFFNEIAVAEKSKIGLREVVLFCPKKLTRVFNQQSSLGKYLENQKLLNICQQDLGRENLLVSFPYQPEQVDRVSYHIGDANKRFYLTIKPKKGSQPLDYQQVDYSYIGSSADLLILFGVNELEDLGNLYINHQSLYQNTPAVTLNSFLPDFGTLNLDISGSSGYGEAIFYLLKSLANLLNLEMNSFKNIEQLASLLLTSISLKTKNFTSRQMTADSFLAVAELLKLGAERLVEFNNSEYNVLVQDAKGKAVKKKGKKIKINRTKKS